VTNLGSGEAQRKTGAKKRKRRRNPTARSSTQDSREKGGRSQKNRPSAREFWPEVEGKPLGKVLLQRSEAQADRHFLREGKKGRRKGRAIRTFLRDQLKVKQEGERPSSGTKKQAL